MKENIRNVCNFYGSFDKEKFDVLTKIYSQNGKYESYYDEETFEKYEYHLGHTEEPIHKSSEIHPAIFNYPFGLRHKLYQYGEVKSFMLSDMIWNTQFLLNNFIEKGVDFLSDVDGIFACYYIGFLTSNENHYIFRNELANLYFSDIDMSVSVSKLDGFYLIEPNVVYLLDFKIRKLRKTKLSFMTRDSYDFR
jgi:hypothetical protein